MPVASGRWLVPAAGRTASVPVAEPIPVVVVAVSNSVQTAVDVSDIDSAASTPGPGLRAAVDPAEHSPEAAPMPAVVRLPLVGQPWPPPVPPVPSVASSESP